MKTPATNYQTKTILKQTSMNSIWSLRIYVIAFSLIFCTDLIAQSGLIMYTDAGVNNVSGGLFIKAAVIGHCNFGKNRVGTGFQIDLKNNNNLLLSGFTINTSRYLAIKGVPFELQGFYTLSRNSKLLNESNWGTLLKMRHNRFEMKVGTNLRTYTFSDKAVNDYEIDKRDVRIKENFNLMYSFSCYFKKSDKVWNVGLSVTNIDNFIINQETNPVLSICGFYNPVSKICLYAESWYKTAGTCNLNINHFGFYFRTGIKWNFN